MLTMILVMMMMIDDYDDDDDDDEKSVVDFATILRKFVEQKKILGKLLEPAELPDMNFPTLQLILSKPRKIGLFFVPCA